MHKLASARQRSLNGLLYQISRKLSEDLVIHTTSQERRMDTRMALGRMPS